jgi:hypothetical protein
MAREICFLVLVMSLLLLRSLAIGQAPPPTKIPVAPKADQLRMRARAQTRRQRVRKRKVIVRAIRTI